MSRNENMSRLTVNALLPQTIIAEDGTIDKTVGLDANGQVVLGTPSGGGAGLVDGDYGDITVSGTGTVMTIDNLAITAGKIADGAVTNAKVATGIDAVKIADGTVTNAEFQYLGGVTSDIQTQLDGKQATLGNNSITNAMMTDNSVGTAEIIDSNVTNAKLATGIDATKIADGTVTNAEFQYLGGVTSDLQTQLNGKQATLVANDITNSLIASNAVTTAKIADANVTYAKIQNATTNRLIGRATAGTGVLEEITLGTNLSFTGTTLNAATGGGYVYATYSISGPVTYDKTDFGGANYIRLRTNSATPQTVTISNTGFVANDFLFFEFRGSNTGPITLIIGATGTPKTYSANIGTTLLCLYDGTNWHITPLPNTINTEFDLNGNLGVGIGIQVNQVNNTNLTIIGHGSTANGTNTGATLVGQGITTTANNTVAIGQGITISTGGTNTIAIGQGVNTSTHAGVVAIGQGITTAGTDAVIIGRGAVGSTRGISIGTLASGTGSDTIRIGYNVATSATGDNTVAIGNNVSTQGLNNIAIGYNVATGASTTGATVIGTSILTAGIDSVIIGRAAGGTGTNTVIIGATSSASTNTGVVAIGQGITTTNVDNVIIGRGASGGGTGSIAIGPLSAGSGSDCVRIGHGINTSTGVNIVTIGRTITAGGNRTVAIGTSLSIASQNAVTIGNTLTISDATDAILIGYNTNMSAFSLVRPIAIGISANILNTGTENAIAIGSFAQATKTRQFAKGTYAYPRHYGAESRRIDTNTSTTDATNPSRHDDNTAWIGSTNNSTLEMLLFAQTGEYLTVQNAELLHFMVMVSAKKEGATDSRVMIMNGAAVATGGVASLVGSGLIGTSDFNNSAGAAALTATLGVTSNRITMTVSSTDPASTGTWQWTANIINITRTRTA